MPNIISCVLYHIALKVVNSPILELRKYQAKELSPQQFVHLSKGGPVSYGVTQNLVTTINSTFYIKRGLCDVLLLTEVNYMYVGCTVIQAMHLPGQMVGRSYLVQPQRTPSKPPIRPRKIKNEAFRFVFLKF